MGENKGFDIKAGAIDSSPNASYNVNNNIDSKDKIVFEVKHNPSWWDYLILCSTFIFALIGSIGLTQIFFDNEMNLVIFIFLGLFWGGVAFSSYYLFYTRKNKIYITNQGIGFERRNWFRMQKGFFKFGEVGIVTHFKSLGLYPTTPPRLITIFPLGAIKSKYFYFLWRLKPYCIIRLIAWDYYLSPKLYDEVYMMCLIYTSFSSKKPKKP
ncbi:hypothetical protein OQH61_05810 [Helicobacter sp. MIT 21-1697]|uniref:hypothetical protein n=1 Tax=Helicobacter sp. MIT 21-1697 TaxID=2993733 RepID=UPI00224B7B06|nr:hypothetical protein [Helicobacter sp. MIT 21-1697]MCX2717250.1 hypothetical protein [Helicobacter sp. MIT 21-1697]